MAKNWSKTPKNPKLWISQKSPNLDYFTVIFGVFEQFLAKPHLVARQNVTFWRFGKNMSVMYPCEYYNRAWSSVDGTMIRAKSKLTQLSFFLIELSSCCHHNNQMYDIHLLLVRTQQSYLHLMKYKFNILYFQYILRP